MASGHRRKQGGKRPRPSTGSSPEGPALLPAIKNMLAEEIGKVLERIQILEHNFEAKIKKFEGKLNDVVNSVTFNGQNISELQQKVKEDKETVNQEIDSLKSYINRENLLFHGIAEGNQQEDVENLLRDFFVEHLRLDRVTADKIEFQRAHRINSARRPRPIIARFLRYKDRAAVFLRAKNLKGSRMFITEDLPLRIRERQRAQLPALKAARSSGPERVSNSAPSSKPRPSNHDRQNSEGSSSSSLKKTNTPPRLPKINTLVTGAPESASTSSADSPLLKPKPSKPKDGGKKTTSPSTTKETNSSLSSSDGASHSKGDRLKGNVEENNNVVTSTGKDVTQSKKLPSKHQDEKKNSVESVHRDGPSVRLKDSTAATERKKEEKHGKAASKSVINETSDGYQRTNAIKEDFSLNVSDQSAKVSDKIPKRTSERSIPEKKKENVNHKRLSESHADKTPSKFSDDHKSRTLANGTLTKSHSQSTIPKQRVNDVESPTKAPPSRPTNSRVGTSVSSRVNPRSKSDLVKVKPPMQRRRTKTGFFTSSGEFVTNDEDGKQSEVSGETSRTKRTDATTRTGRSNASGSTTSTKSSSKMTTSELVKKPLRRRPFIITKKTLSRQKFYNSVYNNQHFKIQRQTVFLKKVEKAQLRMDDEKTRESINSQKKKHESVVRQYQTLKRIRDKFDEEQVKRFSRQYVSWRSVEEDRLNRQSTVYGLPDNIYQDRYDKTLKEIPKVKKSKSKSNLKSNDKKFSRFARWVRNIRRFEQILKPNTGAGLEDSMLRSTRGALVEGRDIVELHQSRDDGAEGGEGPIKTKKVVKVRNVIGSAKRLLQATQDMDAISEVSDENDDDDDDDDYSDVSSLDLSDDE